MHIDIISDLHVEHHNPYFGDAGIYYPWAEQKTSDILLIAGDNSNDPRMAVELLRDAKEHYEHVLYTDGNHDHYSTRRTGQTVSDVEEYYRTKSSAIGYEYLHGDKPSVVIDGTAFIGSNGWYDWKSHSKMSYEEQKEHWNHTMSDSRVISFVDLPDVLAQKQADIIKHEIQKYDVDNTVDKIVIMTHTIPHQDGVVGEDHQWAELNGSFVNTCMFGLHTLSDKIKVWNFGHTHFHYDFVDSGVRFFCNPRGYKFEHTFDDQVDVKSVEI